MTPVENRRRVPRRSFFAPVGLLLAGRYTVERSFQVGEGGMMISIGGQGSLPPVGQQVVLSFFVPNGALVLVRGTVRNQIPADRENPIRFGVEFMNLGFQAKREIRNFVAAATQLDGHIR
jgi:hypothetical protein